MGFDLGNMVCYLISGWHWGSWKLCYFKNVLHISWNTLLVCGEGLAQAVFEISKLVVNWNMYSPLQRTGCYFWFFLLFLTWESINGSALDYSCCPHQLELSNSNTLSYCHKFYCPMVRHCSQIAQVLVQWQIKANFKALSCHYQQLLIYILLKAEA